MLRRGVGVAALKRREQTQQTFKAVGAELEEAQVAHLRQSLSTFRSSLESFAFRHKDAIRSDPVFRAQFHRMCHTLGVDPLAATVGFWNRFLGLGDFYYELGVQAVDVCLSARDENGGIMKLSELEARMKKKYRYQQNITQSDLREAVSKLSCLGSGFALLSLDSSSSSSGGGDQLVKCVPLEMSVDHVSLMQFVATERTASSSSIAGGRGSTVGERGCVRPSEVRSVLGWSPDRLESCINLLLHEGMLWIDAQDDTEHTYWFPSLALTQQ